MNIMHASSGHQIAYTACTKDTTAHINNTIMVSERAPDILGKYSWSPYVCVCVCLVYVINIIIVVIINTFNNTVGLHTF